MFSTDGGAEMLPFPEFERRAAHGWRGFLVASSKNLPAALIEPWSNEVGQRPENQDRWRPGHLRSADDPLFGEELGLNSVAQQAAWLAFGDEARVRERNLRLLAMARGVQDLRRLDTGYDRAGRSRGLPSAVWHGLLASGQDLDLVPFEAPGGSGWKPHGSGIPLGVLADVQVYAVNADPRFQGKGHSATSTRQLPAEAAHHTAATGRLERPGKPWTAQGGDVVRLTGVDEFLEAAGRPEGISHSTTAPSGSKLPEGSDSNARPGSVWRARLADVQSGAASGGIRRGRGADMSRAVVHLDSVARDR
ncbi:hypothetical protein [Streptomyces jumonjinensis]|uniref:hypothetical protein n=1 Tax=Streptomyces jumonjinensis TaxID=1945 RepID=UPI0012976791|nr:hypothetical protein [Streptomyces jumonjinensis]